ncbi:MAG: VCBS repeat-containing protein [Bacteroidetes bacterium]|nr:VCBS repeat-containing protein [Fibrella sp.]
MTSSYRWLVFALTTLLMACGGSQQTSAPPTLAVQASNLTGAQLSRVQCGGCHQFPEPDLLEKSVWQHGILPKMALRFGLLTETTSLAKQIEQQDELTDGVKLGVFPANQTLADADWQKIVAYYESMAPAHALPAAPKTPVSVGLPLFTLRTPAKPVEALVMLLKYDSAARCVFVGSRRGHLLRLDGQLNRLDSTFVQSPPSDVHGYAGGRFDVLTMGIMDPNDSTAGTLSRRQNGVTTPLMPNLKRPVHASYGDLNGDGREDAVVCQFGNHTGQLTWLEQQATGYRAHVLDPVPGARNTIIRDVNGDGRPDVIALLSQGDEQVAVYYNVAGEDAKTPAFRKETVLRFPPVYGSSYLEMSDVNRDGFPDLIYTNGDNADYSHSLKAYHGVRIFLNDGHFRFKQAWFYPMNGASKVLARDFDGDGDMDLAAIAYFPDYTKSTVESFIYFEHQGGLTFKPRTFANPARGHWLTMDAGDVDQDGDDDLLLGSFGMSSTPVPAELKARWRQEGKGVLLLENRRFTKGR